MKKVTLSLICICYMPGIFAFLHTPEFINRQHLEKNKTREISSKLWIVEDTLDKESGHEVEELLSDDEMQELRNTVFMLKDYEVYEDGIYDPFSDVIPRKKRSLGNDLSNLLGGMVEALEKSINSSVGTEKSKYLEKAADLLDNYLMAVKGNRDAAKANALQIFKQEDANLMLVNCGGWLWYPLRRIKKVITCKNGIMRFENRYQKVAQVCDNFVCKKVKM